MKVLGLFIGVVTTTADITLNRFQTFVSCYNDPSGITVTLMASPRVGKTYFIKRINTAGVTIDGGAADLVFNSTPVGTHAIVNRGETVMLFWDGSYWQGNVI